ncbi:MAG: sugar phosphate isomerase/epimerase [Armatimonadetes bacterium]|nr:sugar phosphate isomerase/epimerase [Armatimonadota bacterium]
MRYATAIWNYAEEGVRLPELVREFVGFGYDTISFSSGNFGDMKDPDVREAARVIEEQRLGVTVHCAFDFGIEGVTKVLELFGDAVLAVTFDPMSEVDSCGMCFATGAMAPAIAEILRRSEGSELRVGIEDLPLDEKALERYREDLGPLAEEPRYGMLIDVGHLNMRLRRWKYFAGLPVAEYITRIPVPIIEAHLHDNNGEGDQHGYLGFGNLDFAAVAEGLKAAGFEGVSTVEIAPSFHGSTPAASKPRAKESLAQWKALWEA